MIRSRIRLAGGLAGALTVLGAASGCVVREQPVTYASAGYVSEPGYSAEVYVQAPPPAPVVEYPPPPPAYGYVWINGYWDWGGSDWYWQPGYYATPRHGYVYVAPRYIVHNGRYVYHRSYWMDGRGQRDYYYAHPAGPGRGRGSWRGEPNTATAAPPAGGWSGSRPAAPVYGSPGGTYNPAPPASGSWRGTPAAPGGGGIPAGPTGGGPSPAGPSGWSRGNPAPAQPSPSTGSPSGAFRGAPPSSASGGVTAGPQNNPWRAGTPASPTPAPAQPQPQPTAQPLPAPSNGRWQSTPMRPAWGGGAQPAPAPAPRDDGASGGGIRRGAPAAGSPTWSQPQPAPPPSGGYQSPPRRGSATAGSPQQQGGGVPTGPQDGARRKGRPAQADR